jgi:hypothetical protein
MITQELQDSTSQQGRLRLAIAAAVAASMTSSLATVSASPVDSPHRCTAIYGVAPRCQFVVADLPGQEIVASGRDWRVTDVHRDGRRVTRIVYTPTRNTSNCAMNNPLLLHVAMDCFVAWQAGDVVIVQVLAPGQVSAGVKPWKSLHQPAPGADDAVLTRI